MDVALDSAGAVRSRPFGPLPRAAVAVYGLLLAAAGLILWRQSGHLDGYGAAGVNALLLGVACVVLAARAGRSSRRPAPAVVEPPDPRLAAARVVAELADLERQLEELTEQCATFEAPHWADGDR